MQKKKLYSRQAFTVLLLGAIFSGAALEQTQKEQTQSNFRENDLKVTWMKRSNALPILKASAAITNVCNGIFMNIGF